MKELKKKSPTDKPQDNTKINIYKISITDISGFVKGLERNKL